MKLTIKQIIINAVITLVIAAVMFYIMLPPVTLHSKLFVTYLAIVLVIFAVLCYGRTLLQGKLPFEGGFKVGPAEIALIGAAAVVALTAVIGWLHKDLPCLKVPKHAQRADRRLCRGGRGDRF